MKNIKRYSTIVDLDYFEQYIYDEGMNQDQIIFGKAQIQAQSFFLLLSKGADLIRTELIW